MAAGYRGHVAPWIGGLSSPPAAPAGGAGYRGHLFFWIGGLCAPVSTPPEPAPDATGGRLLRAAFIRRQNEAIIAAVTALAASGVLQ